LTRLVILDYSLGNLMSISKAFESLGSDIIVSRDKKIIRESDALILPGVGAFEDAMKNISPIKSTVLEAIEGGRQALGICLGLQILFTESTEGGLRPGLNIWRGRVDKLPTNVKVPHIGWNTLDLKRTDRLTEGIENGAYVYFVHSYYGNPPSREMIIAETNYGVIFPSIISGGSVYATQFHPEKSGKTGLLMLKNFIRMVKR
jgi:glutamine amidotransferase